MLLVRCYVKNCFQYPLRELLQRNSHSSNNMASATAAVSDEVAAAIARAAEYVAGADALYVTCGAGLGVDSGLPDFRGTDGFWKAYPIFQKLGRSFAEAAQPKFFETEPDVVWFFYGHRMHLYRDAVPHSGYHTILRWMAEKPGAGFVFTSNVDGAWVKAGLSPDSVMEVHGNINLLQCTRGETCKGYKEGDSIWSADGVTIDVDTEHGTCDVATLPRCPRCGKLARPNVVMFNDDTVLYDRIEAQNARKREFLKAVAAHKRKVCVIDIGSGTAIPTCRRQSENVAELYNAPIIRINPRESFFDSLTGYKDKVSIPLGSAHALGLIDAKIAELRGLTLP